MANPFTVTTTIATLAVKALKCVRLLRKVIDDAESPLNNIVEARILLCSVEDVLSSLLLRRHNLAVDEHLRYSIEKAKVGITLENCRKACTEFHCTLDGWVDDSHGHNISS